MLASAPIFAAGCAVKVKTQQKVQKQEIRPLMEASKQQLIDEYNQQVRAVHSLQATVNLVPSTGSTYSGVIEQYHNVSGFILAQRPDFIRLIGQAPVVAKNIFDMVSNGKTFRIFIPSKNMFLVGSTSLQHPSKKPIENLRPQHIVEALFWTEIPQGTQVLFEQFDEDPYRYYILTLLRRDEAGSLEIARKIWFDRADLHISRLQIYGAGGLLNADIKYSEWEPVAAPQAGSTAFFPRGINIWRPQDDYKLQIQISKLTVNQEITPDRFELAQPPGTRLVHAGEDSSPPRQ